MKSMRVDRRADRRFIPVNLFNGEGNSLEPRNLTAPQPGFLLNVPNPGIGVTANGPATPPDTNLSGTMERYSYNEVQAAPGIDAKVTSEAHNRVISGGSTNPSNSLSVSINLDQTYEDSNGTTQFTITPFSTAFTTGAIGYTLVDMDNPAYPTWNLQQNSVLINGSFTVEFSPAAGLPGFVSGFAVAFASAASGVTITGPVTDPSTGDPNALVVTYPTVVGSTTVFHTDYYDGFAVNGGTVSENFEAFSSATAEAIAYGVGYGEQFTDVIPGSWQSQLVLNFGEAVNAYP